jgi:hypothetical protein
MQYLSYDLREQLQAPGEAKNIQLWKRAFPYFLLTGHFCLPGSGSDPYHCTHGFATTGYFLRVRRYKRYDKSMA